MVSTVEYFPPGGCFYLLPSATVLSRLLDHVIVRVYIYIYTTHTYTYTHTYTHTHTHTHTHTIHVGSVSIVQFMHLIHGFVASFSTMASHELNQTFKFLKKTGATTPPHLYKN